MSGVHRARGDLDQAWEFLDWALNAEIELQEMSWRKRRTA
jgi:hypothetical protein